MLNEIADDGIIDHMEKYILSIDQGTSGTKAIIFSSGGEIYCEGRAPLKSSYPQEGYVEQDGEDIIESVLISVQDAKRAFEERGGKPDQISCCGISNQRETFLIWDKTGKPLAPAIVWQCKRSIPVCRRLLAENLQEYIRNRTGLFIDPYFSATKIIRLTEKNPEIKKKIKNGKVFFGNVDTWLLFRLTGGRSYKTDYTNASRTMLFNLKTLKWDPDLLKLFDLENLNLPGLCPSGSEFGASDFSGILPSPIPVTAMIGDSQAAAFGERCFEPGSAKATMGTGSSVLLNTGKLVEPSNTSMVSTVCWSTAEQTAYALEGIIVSCGSTITWLKDQLGLFGDSAQAAKIAESTESSGSVILIPAFSGLGAPWWNMSLQASINGLTFESNKNQIIRAGFESIAFQVTDVIRAMEKDMNRPLKSIQIDGGVSESSLVMNTIAGLNGASIIKCRLREASALGAAFMAGLTAGVFDSIEVLKDIRYNDEKISAGGFDPVLSDKYKKWVEILSRLV